VGTVAGLRPEKRVDRTIDAFAECLRSAPFPENWRLKIAGSGPELPKLTEQVNNLSIQEIVEFKGHLDNPSEFYAGLDVFVLGSDTEQMPLVVLEAMASRLPIASTDVGDVSAMVCGANRKIIEGKTAKALGDQITRLFEQPDLRKECGEQNLSKVAAEYSFEKMANRWEKLIISQIVR
jgi:L-malate glycosyltransferase